MSMAVNLGTARRHVVALPRTPVTQAFRLGAWRLPNEFYPTPPEATRALLSVEPFDASIWEPACGEGAIASVLKDAGHAVVATDLVDYGYGLSGIDFLKEVRPRARHIVTNPPYGSGLADAFVMQSLRFARQTQGKVAMLLNLASLAHRSRTAWWQANPPARLYAVDDIVCWPVHRYGPPPIHFTKHRYVWAVWTPDHQGPAAFWWLSSADFRTPHLSSKGNHHGNPRTFHISLFVKSYFDGSVQAASEDEAIAETYRLWRTECPHPFERCEDSELIQVIASEVPV